MSDGRFDIVFRGDIAPGQVLPQVKQRLAALFKRELAQIEPLFSGAPVALKKDVDQLSAEKYKKVLAQAGALVEIREAGTLKAPAVRPRPAAQPAAAAKTPPADAAGRAAPVATGLSLVPVGGYLLTEDERKQVEEPIAPVPQVDFELRPLEGSLVDENEIERMAPVQVAEVEFDISEPGVELVDAQYKEVIEAVVVADLNVDLAPAGTDLGQLPKEPAPPAPDTSGISLAD